MRRGDDVEDRGAATVIRLLMKAYPEAFRARFGEGFRYSLLRDLSLARRAGLGATARFWVRTAVGTLLNGLRERLRRRGEAPRGKARPGPRRIIARRDGGRMERWLREARFAFRRLMRRPLFTLTVALTLALGIGGATAIFSVVEGVILRPLPYPDDSRLVLVGHRSASGPLAVPDGGYFYYADHASTLESLAVYIESSTTVAGTGEPLELGIIQATPSLLPTLGVNPILGRGLATEDAEPGADPVAVVSYGYWVRQLGADTAALGGPVAAGSDRTVIGVLPRGFDFPRPNATFVLGNRFDAPDLFTPLPMDRSGARFGNFMYQGIGRLAPGASPEDAERELNRLMPGAAETYVGPEAGPGFTPEELRQGQYRAVVKTVKDAMVGDMARVLWILMGAVGVVLLIATANVASLFLVRAETRRGDLALQQALGAGRGALVRSFLSESVLLALMGGTLGVLLASGGTRLLVALAPGQIPRSEGIGLNLPVLLFAAGVSLIVGMAFGVVPLLRGGRRGIGTELAAGGQRGTMSRGRRKLREGLIVLQVALALVLLVGSGLLLRTVQNLHEVEPGFQPANLLTLRLSLGENLVRGAGYDDGADDAVRSRFMLDVVRRLRALPGVEEASFSGDLPLDGDERYDYVAVEGALPGDFASAEKALRVFIGPGYLKTIGARLLQGRELEDGEFARQPRSVVVNRAFAEERWPGGDAVGKRLLQYWPGVDPDGDVWYTVVGVVENVREKSLMAPPEPVVYLPTVFLPEGNFGMPVSNFVAVLRTAGPPGAAIPRVREAIRAFQPEIPVNDVMTMESLAAESFQEVTFAMVLLVIAGGASTLLGLVGIYATVAYVVSLRTREFGLRLALGASAGNVRWGVVREAAMIGGAGVALGVVGSLASGRVLGSLLFGVAATDPVVIAAVAAALLSLVVVSALGPAVRAGSVDPVEAMRAE